MVSISRAFRGRPRDEQSDRLPPGQYATRDFPVLSAGPTPVVRLEDWQLSVSGAGDQPRTWSWDEFRALPSEEVTVDIHCRSEEHTSELQSRQYLVCRLLLEKKKNL